MAEKITQEDFDRYILDWHITRNNHVWIDGITGGYVETMDCGRYYRADNHYNAIIHRIKHIKQLQKEYSERMAMSK